jgi:hypothetical protein
MKPLNASIGRESNALTQTLHGAIGKCALVFLSLLLFQNAHATLYLLEPFDYPAGPLTNALPWSTNGTAVEGGTPTLQLVSGDLSYPPLTDPAPASQAKLQYSNNVKGIRQIPGAPLGDPSAGGSVYVSFIFYKATTNGTTANAPIVGINVNNTETINQAAVNGMVLYHQQSGGVGNYHLGIKVGGGTTGMLYPPGTQVYASGNTTTGDLGQTNFVVMKYSFVSGAGNDTVALWVNPDPSSFGGAEPAATTNDVAEAAVAGATDAVAGLSYFQIRGGASGAAGTVQLDNIRVASTWAEVAPTCISAGTTDPANQSVSPGQTATFSVTGSGLNPTYQWQTNHGGPFVNIAGATNSSYTTPAEVLGDNGEQFRCVVNVACNGSSVTSAVATLTVQTCVAAAVTDPGNQTVDAGQTATFSVTGTGTSRTLQWQTNNGGGWVNVTGATGASYTTPPVQVANEGLQVRCVVSVTCGGGSSATSAAATLHVVCTTAGVTNPQNQVVVRGQTATFSVTGSGSTRTYQWATNNGGGFVNITGATNSTYTTAPTVDADYGLQFQCTVSVACDSSVVTSAAASLVVNCDPATTTDPVSQALGAGQTATFTVTGGGSLPVFQWQKSTDNGSTWNPISGATTASYTTPPAVVGDNGSQFRCVVSACGPTTATSATATLSVSPGTARFRSIASGNLSDPNTWEASYDGGSTWTTPAGYAPADINSTNISVQNGHNVTNAGNARLDQLVVQAGGQLTVKTGTTLTLTNGPGTALDISGTVDVIGTLLIVSNAPVVVKSGGILKTEQGGTYTVNGTLTVNSGGKYQHNYTTGVGTIPNATWNAGSICEIIGYTTDTTTMSGLAGQTFHHFTWNCPNQTAALPFGGNVPVAVLGDFTVVSTGTGEIRLAQNNSPVWNIAGNLVVQGGVLTLAAGTGKPVLNVSNNVSLVGGTLSNSTASAGATINFAKSGSQTFANSATITGPINWVVKSGSTLNGGGNVMSSSLTLASGGQIRLSTSLPLFTVSGNLTNNGNTVVADLGGATLGAGTYHLMNYTGNSSGALSAGPTLLNGSALGTAAIDISTPGQVNLAVITSQPKIGGFSVSGGTLTIGASNGTPGVTCGVLASTNVLLPLSQWIPIVRNGSFNGGGTFSTNLNLTGTANGYAPQQFFLFQSPSP